jgi:phenylpyruvate tautomerase PptA (4-oxalocrotonate tautomerase family)
MSPHYLQLLLYELPRENISFGRGLAQRAGISAGTESESDASRGRRCRSLNLRAAAELAPPRWSWRRIARTPLFLQTRDQMPTYACSAAAGRLTPGQKVEIVQSITAIHHEETGAPRYLVQVIFYDIDPVVTTSAVNWRRQATYGFAAAYGMVEPRSKRAG